MKYLTSLKLEVPLLEGASDEIQTMHAMEYVLLYTTKDANERERVIAWLDDKYGMPAQP